MTGGFSQGFSDPWINLKSMILHLKMKIKQSQRKTDAGHLTFNEDNESNKTTAYILLMLIQKI